MSNTDKQLQKVTKDTFVSTNLTFNTQEEFLSFCATIAKSSLSPLKKAEDVAVAILAGNSLQVNTVAALNNIYPINGRATLGIHLIEGLLRKGGVITEILEDYQPVYPVFIYDYDDKGEVKRDKDKKPVILEVVYKFRSEVDKDVDKVLWKPKGIGTKVRLTRMLKQPDNTFKEMVITKSYTTIDADKVTNKAGETIRQQKDVWNNYESEMLYASAFRRASKIIGDDLCLGLYETTELLDTTNINYTLGEEGEIEILDKEGKKVIKEKV